MGDVATALWREVDGFLAIIIRKLVVPALP